MTEKAELQTKLNDALGTDIEWRELNENDLQKLWRGVEEGVLLEPLAKHQMKNYGKEGVDEAVDNWEPGQIMARLL